MAQVQNLLDAVGVVGGGKSVALPPELSNRGVTVSVGGITGAVAAKVHYQVSNNQGKTWSNRLSFDLSGSSTLTLPVTDADSDPSGPFPLVRGFIETLTGTGATVSMDVCAANTRSSA